MLMSCMHLMCCDAATRLAVGILACAALTSQLGAHLHADMMYPHHCRVDRGVLRIKVLKYKELEKEPIIEEVQID